MNVKKQESKHQPDDIVFVLDIGTRSIIGLVGRVEDDKLNVLSIEYAEHPKRSMIDGQIEDIESVAKLAGSVKERLESNLDLELSRVCVAAAGRSLKTEKSTFEMEVPEGKSIDDDIVNRLESGAIAQIEETLDREASEAYKQFYLVGYSAVQYYLDNYPIASLRDHHGAKIKVDILATFLPSEVVESLYAAMRRAELEVASLTLEPIAAINAAIPENLRLLNLAFVDIGAGTSDIAVCKDGNIVGYTMATVAGDEISEKLMREYLIDFDTAEQIKFDLESKKEIYFADIMGFEQSIDADEVIEKISGEVNNLCKEVANKILEVNSTAPSAVFLGGGGSKLRGVLEGVRDALEIDERRISLAGANFKTSAFSKEYDINNPEYATPLGIAVSTGLNMINDSCHVTLNGKRARLFRNGQLNILHVLTMNGYKYRDLFGRSGASLIISVDGKRRVIYGDAATNAVLTLNGESAGPSDMVKAGDVLEFIPATAGKDAKATLVDVVGDAVGSLPITVNGVEATADVVISSGDVILTGDNILKYKSQQKDQKTSDARTADSQSEGDRYDGGDEEIDEIERNSRLEVKKVVEETEPEPVEETEPEEIEEEYEPEESSTPMEEDQTLSELLEEDDEEEEEAEEMGAEVVQEDAASELGPLRRRSTWHFTLNDKPITFPAKPDFAPYLLLDLLEHSGLDFDNLTAPVILAVNGMPGIFQQELRERDSIIIKLDEGEK